MKYEYITATGRTEIEVDEGFYEVLVMMDKEEYNADRKHSRRHPVPLEGAEYEGEWFSDGTDILSDLVQKESHERLHGALGQLTSDQKTLVRKIYFDGISPSEIVRREGVDKSAITHRLDRVYKRLQKLLK